MAVAQLENTAFEGKLLQEFRAPLVDQLDEVALSYHVRQIQALVGSKQKATVTISSQKIDVVAGDGRKFSGDAPSDLTVTDSPGVLNSRDKTTLYADTVCYTFTPGPVDTIEFKDDSDTVLGTWKGKCKPAVTQSFTYPGTW